MFCFTDFTGTQRYVRNKFILGTYGTKIQITYTQTNTQEFLVMKKERNF